MITVWMIDSVITCLPHCRWPQKDHANEIFVECYVPVDDLQEALERTREALFGEGFELVTIDRCMRFHEEHWDGPLEGHRKVREAVWRAQRTNQVL